MTKEEFERELREELHLSEVASGNWVGRTTIPEFAVMQPFILMVRLIELPQREVNNRQNQLYSAVAVGINLALRVENNHEAVYKKLLEINAERTLGAFSIDDEGQIAIGAEIPCGPAENYFSREELGVMIMTLFGAIKDYYNTIVQLIHVDKPVETNFLDKWKTFVGKRDK